MSVHPDHVYKTCIQILLRNFLARTLSRIVFNVTRNRDNHEIYLGKVACYKRQSVQTNS